MSEAEWIFWPVGILTVMQLRNKKTLLVSRCPRTALTGFEKSDNVAVHPRAHEETNISDVSWEDTSSCVYVLHVTLSSVILYAMVKRK